MHVKTQSVDVVIELLLVTGKGPKLTRIIFMLVIPYVLL
jgi:hypothetical protein